MIDIASTSSFAEITVIPLETPGATEIYPFFAMAFTCSAAAFGASPYRSAEDQKICKPEAGVGSGMSGTDKRIPGTEAAERRSERIETKCLYTKSKRNDYQKSFLFCQTHGRFLPQYHHQRTENKMGKL